VRQVQPHAIFAGIPDNTYFYFLHSFYVEPEDRGVIIGETEYGVPFPAIIARDNIVATQFHPEKSSGCGLRLYANFLSHALGDGSPK
jgi:glutamine amidotransferase